jgi:ribosome-binding ATPase YchF (GTP1/OBG family)
MSELTQDDTSQKLIQKTNTSRGTPISISTVVAYTDLVAAGTLAEARNRGTLRTEGKEYIVKDGDVIEFKI